MLALVLPLVLLWSLTHHYLGLGGDARLYAVQALARTHPNLFHDLYLQNTSQDSYTFFSSLYGPSIGLIGLRNAALTLTLAFKILFFAASWVLARHLFQGACGYLSIALLILIPGVYGAYGVFHYAEDWLTARSAAEALVVTAIACSVCGRRVMGLMAACGAMLLHPLMALPGLLWLVSLQLPFRRSALAAAAGLLLMLVLASIVSRGSFVGHLFAVPDAVWLEVIRERSQFLLLQFWRVNDWSMNIRPLLSLSLSVLVIDDPQARKAGATAILVGAAGLILALIASLVGPVAILLQGQAWRWVWVTTFASVLFLTPTFRALWRAERCGLLCVLLVICGWTFSTIGGTLCVAFAIILWLMRDFIGYPAAKVLRGMGIWWKSLLHAPAIAFGLLTRRNTLAITQLLALSGLIGACLFCLPRALDNGTDGGIRAEIDAYSDWRHIIPPDANVFVAPDRNSAAFAWFTLQRPSYLTVDQSSGVVFSRATALEVKRRSQVLLPLMDPDWKVLSNMAQPSRGKTSPSVRPLTRERLMSICRDPQLNFVVGTENIGFEPLRHARARGLHDWYLYDCRIVDGADPTA
jgi:hypothetical protein